MEVFLLVDRYRPVFYFLHESLVRVAVSRPFESFNFKTTAAEEIRNLCCGCSLESPRRGDSNGQPQHKFL